MRNEERLKQIVDRKAAAELRKMWYKHVLATIEKLDENIDDVSDELREFKDKILDDLGELKETIQRDMISCRKGESSNLYKFDRKVTKGITSVERRLEKLEKLEKSDIKDLKESMAKLKEEDLEPMQKLLTEAKIKVAIFSAIGGVIMTIILFLTKPVVSKLLELLIKKYLGE
jgi:hypothetical protein